MEAVPVKLTAASAAKTFRPGRSLAYAEDLALDVDPNAISQFMQLAALNDEFADQIRDEESTILESLGLEEFRSELASSDLERMRFSDDELAAAHDFERAIQDLGIDLVQPEIELEWASQRMLQPAAVVVVVAVAVAVVTKVAVHDVCSGFLS
jgi:hypothetical protein